jgi:hypothetical protein
MADATLELLRQDTITKRLNNVGGNRVHWGAKDGAMIRDYVMSMSLNMFVRDVPLASRKLFDTGAAAVRRKLLSEQGTTIRDAHPTDRKFLFVISSDDVDLAGDVVTPSGIDFANFVKNPAVLNAHDSSTLPIASSASPVVSGKTVTAIAKFPRPDVSECSDQVAAALRGGLVKGASVGFVPLKWAFTKDPSRPFGVDFLQIRLLEWSVCAIPCNPACLLLGTVDGQSSSRSSSQSLAPDSDAKKAARLREAGAIAAKTRSLCASISDSPAPTRDQRLAEAETFRRVAFGGK